MSTIPEPREGWAYQARGDGSGREIALADLEKFAADPSRIHIVSMFSRPGAIEFLAAVESRLFPSDTILESALVIHALLWKGIPWNIQSVPVKALEPVQAIAAEFEFVVRNTVPVVAQAPGVTVLGAISIHREAPDYAWFPLKLPNVYTLESDQETSPVHPGSAPRQGWG